MGRLSMCRVCLGEDARLYSIVGTHLQEMYESLVLIPLETSDGRPVLACYICCARLKNCYELRKSCLQSDELFTQMLSSKEPEQVKLRGINSAKRLTMNNVIHLSLGHALEMNANNVGVEAVKSEVKLEPAVGEGNREDALEENRVFDNVQSSDSGDDFVHLSLGYVLEMNAVNVGVEALKSEVKFESTHGEDIDEDALEGNSVCDNVQSTDSGDDFVIIVKEEQTGDMTIGPTPKASTQDDQRYPEDLTSSNLKHHVLVQDTVQDLLLENSTHTAQKPHQCNVCHRRFSRIQYLARHMLTHTSEQPYHCDLCSKRFSLKVHLIIHMRIHTGEKPYHCHLCDKRFTSNSFLMQHLRTHTGEKPYYCDICKNNFSVKGNLIRHMRTQHSGEKLFSCDMCEKQFTTKTSLEYHKRTYTGERPYHCHLCDKRFLSKSNLRQHLPTHTGEKPHYCDICKKYFSLKANLIKHMRTHSGENLFSCDMCEKRFTIKAYLECHKRTHTGERPYHCHICNKRFSRRRYLNSHLLSNTCEKPNQSDMLCNTQLRQSSWLRRLDSLKTY